MKTAKGMQKEMLTCQPETAVVKSYPIQTSRSSPKFVQTVQVHRGRIHMGDIATFIAPAVVDRGCMFYLRVSATVVHNAIYSYLSGHHLEAVKSCHKGERSLHVKVVGQRHN